MNILQARGLSRHFGGLVAVDNVEFDLPAGQIRAIIGPNGAGKTTLVGLLCGRIVPDAGQVFFDSEDVTRLPAHKRIALGMAYTFQITSIYPKLSLFDNVALAVQRRLPANNDDLREETIGALDRVGLGDRVSEIAGDLSYGHQRLLEIAMGLGQRPRLLILDEPTQGLAEVEITAFKHLIRQVANDTTVLLIEHNMDVVMSLAERITVMNNGRILAEGTPEEIRSNSAVQRAYLGQSDRA